MTARTGYKARYNRKTYTRHTFRVRKDSALAIRLSEYKAAGQSVNWLITELLCAHYKIPMPHRYRFDTVKNTLWPPVEAITEY